MTLGAEIRKFEPIAKIVGGDLPIKFSYFDYDFQVGMVIDRSKKNRRAWRINGNVHQPRETIPGRWLEKLGLFKPRYRSKTPDETKLDILWMIRGLKEDEQWKE